MKIAVYPGSFDPITNGHLDVIRRAAQVFDQVIVAVAKSSAKQPLFSIAERLEMLRIVLREVPNVRVDAYQGLTVRYAREQGARALIRGLRAVSDFEYEFTMALTNKKLAPEIETVFLMTEAKYSFISSGSVKEVARYGGCVEDMVPVQVERILRDKFRMRGEG
ncbi:MAG: pantetheine-phosphate adenylyltransferase [Bacillota bacterium]|jgi:pantetheine-phosphate adenylyltransferase